MKTRRPLFAVALCLVIVVGGLVWGDNPAHAIVSVVSLGTTTIPYSGTLDGTPEGIFLSGFVLVTMTEVKDPDFGTPPKLLLDVDLSNVTGVGLKSNQPYVASGNQNLVRPYVVSDAIQITFVVYPSKGMGGILSARSALASFTLTFNLATNTLSSAAASTSVNVADGLGTVPVQ